MLDFVEDYMRMIRFEQVGDCYKLTLPFEFFNDYGAITLRLKIAKGGYYIIDDMGATLKYLESVDTNIEDYKNKVEIICTMFSLKIQDGLVKGVIGYGNERTYRQLHNFLQGLSHLSTIKFIN